MRNFINIVESIDSDQYLYHGTSIPNAALILRDNILHVSEDGFDVAGVSLTRNPVIGRSFAAWKSEQETVAVEDNTSIKVPQGFRAIGAIMTFDRRAIQTDYQLKNVQWNNLDDEEEEERVLSSITDLNKYLVSITASIAGIKAWSNIVAACAEQNEIYLPGVDKLILAMLKHPKFK